MSAEVGRGRNSLSSRASNLSAVLPTPWFWPINTDFGLLHSELWDTVFMLFLSHWVCDNLSQQLHLDIDYRYRAMAEPIWFFHLIHSGCRRLSIKTVLVRLIRSNFSSDNVCIIFFCIQTNNQNLGNTFDGLSLLLTLIGKFYHISEILSRGHGSMGKISDFETQFSCPFWQARYFEALLLWKYFKDIFQSVRKLSILAIVNNT